MWVALAARSMLCYSALEEASGIRFHHPVGSLHVALHPCPTLRYTNPLKLPSSKMIESSRAFKAQFPCIHFQKWAAGIIEHGVGYINPRCMVSAQLTVARCNGACIVREERIVPIFGSSSSVKVVMDKGNAKML